MHAAIRDPSKTDRLKYLTDVADASKGSIKFFKADLLEEGSYLEAIKGCSVVFHTASPFMTAVPKGKEQEMLLDPAPKKALCLIYNCTPRSINKESSSFHLQYNKQFTKCIMVVSNISHLRIILANRPFQTVS